MSGLRFPDPLLTSFREAMLDDAPLEACGVAFATHDERTGRFIVREATAVPDAAYAEKTAVSASLLPDYVIEISNRCRMTGDSAVLAHTHPAARGRPVFSEADDAGEADLLRYLGRRGGGGPHAALVIGPEGCSARQLGTDRELPVWQVGRELCQASTDDSEADPEGRFDRQVRAFGRRGQAILRNLHIGVVGVGGTGSIVTQQLAHLGIGALTLIDPDLIEISNLNRVVGSVMEDVGRSKIDVAARMALAIDPSCAVRALQGDVVDADVGDALVPLDFVFSCTDSHASRLVVAHVAYQHLVPAIDMGVLIAAVGGRVTHVAGRTQMFAPGLACPLCTRLLDFDAIRRETATPEQRAADRYIPGAGEPQPAVVSLNSVVASLAVTMFLGAVAGVPATARFQNYDAARGTVRVAEADREPHCPLCSDAALARGRRAVMPVRPVSKQATE